MVIPTNRRKHGILTFVVSYILLLVFGGILILWVGQYADLGLPHAIIVAEASILLHPSHIGLRSLSEPGWPTTNEQGANLL
jgi:hypothetical protein